MKKLIFVLFILILGIKPTLQADEGMWLPMLVERLNYVDMQKMGLQLTAEEIYHANNSSLKDAIIQFGNGCTGSVISKEGLVITNHHCGFGRIQSHSTVEHDYLTDGFWAMTKEEELANEGLTVSFLVRIEDVAQKVLGLVKADMTEAQRAEEINKRIKEISKEATRDNNYRAEVKSFFNGNEYYLFVYETFTDVRLVGAPPSSIGKYGGDTDNWMWPRHTGDFSMFRIYTAPDGTPAKYSKENIPLNPKHYLPVSIDGVKKDDFAMILGYPGGTDRYMTSYGINLNLEQTYPARIKIRRKKLDIMGEKMEVSDKIRIQYASKYSRISNYWKYFIGMSRGLNRLKVAENKKKTEMEFSSWVDQFPSRKEIYGTALKDIEDAYKQNKKYGLQRWYFIEGIYLGPEVIGFSRNFSSLLKELSSENPNQEKIDKMILMLKEKSAKFFKDYDLPTDKILWAEMMKMYSENVPTEQQPSYLISIAKKYKNDFYKFANTVYSKSIFVDKTKLDAFLEKPSAKTIKKDPAFQAMQAFFSNYLKWDAVEQTSDSKLKKGRRLFIDGLMKMKEDKVFYPDANFTMRLSYGKVLDYYPADAIYYNYFTTLKGVMQKEDPTNKEFVVSDNLKKLYETKDFGPYGNNGTMKVCFITNHDITGGNSGSPVINGKGELIGLAFDGNWEAMSGDIAFEPDLQRTINVDIRYVLFVIDKYAGAKNLIDELSITKTPEIK